VSRRPPSPRPGGALGEVILVGAGPGDPELLTVKAHRLIGEADDIVVDALVPRAVYRHARGRVVYVGKRAGRPHVSQEEINRVLVELGRAGRRVVRLKGGDPGVFGRAGEELEALVGAGVRWSIVPGVSSLLAAPAAVGVSLTERGEADRFIVLTGRTQEGRAPSLPAFDPSATLVVLMGLGGLDVLCRALIGRGFPAATPAVLVSEVSLPGQAHVAAELGVMHERATSAGIVAPATLIVGAVARRLLAATRSSETFLTVRPDVLAELVGER
jgi:uroporphyrin-III C-methyltransferase